VNRKSKPKKGNALNPFWHW